MLAKPLSPITSFSPEMVTYMYLRHFYSLLTACALCLSLLIGTAYANEPQIKAPNFSIIDGSGSKVSLPAPGKPIILNFWASWCPPCRSEMADFEKAFKEMGQDINFMMINLTDGRQETLARAQSFIKGNKYTFPAYFDTEFTASQAYGVTVLPTTVFINSEGFVIGGIEGTIDHKTLRAEATKLLKPPLAPAAPAIKQEAKKISPDQAYEMMQNLEKFVILDVRTDNEFKDGHIKNAQLMPYDAIAAQAEINLPDKDTPILVYCRTGRRSAIAAKELATMGYSQIFDFGGVNTWKHELVKE